MGLGDFGAVEGAGDQGFVRAEVVEEELAVNFGGLEEGAALPEQVGFFGRAFDEHVELTTDPGAFGFEGNFLLEAHEFAAAGLDGAGGDLG